MLDIFSSLKHYKDQTPKEKMYILRMVAHQRLGRKWVYYKKIKHAGEGIKILRENSIMEQMKATQAALRFTSRSAKNLYRLAYKTCLNEIKTCTGLSTEHYPKIPEDVDTARPPKLGDEYDAVLIRWTPIKFLLPSKSIRDKGRATQRHSEGLIAKLYFKVVAYYTHPENWESDKLTLYLRKLEPHSTYPEVVAALKPLKADLEKFANCYEPFLFGKASLSKEGGSDEDTFDDAMGVETFEEQIETLYWYNFIYEAMEQFIFRYYMTLVTSTNSLVAIGYLTQIFEPVFQRVIEVRNIFIGSFETDLSKKPFRVPYKKYKEKCLNDPPVKKLKTRQGLFETHTYNLLLLKNNGLSFELDDVPLDTSNWCGFIKYHILNGIKYKTVNKETDNEPLQLEIREYALISIMITMIKCAQYVKRAKHKILERFRKRVEKDKELAERRVKDLQLKAEKKMREMKRKIQRLKRMKQDESVEVYELDLTRFRKKIEDKCEDIKEDTQLELTLQKRRLQGLFQEISRQDTVKEGIAPKFLLQLINRLDLDGSFIRNFTKYTAKTIQARYIENFEPFYQNLFDILQPSTQEKVILIQSLEKSGGKSAVQLRLTDDEKLEYNKMISLLKNKIRHGKPDIFESKIVYQTKLIPIEDIFKISIDNKSLQTMLRLKVVSPKSARPALLKQAVVKALTVLNMVINPVPKHDLIQAGREKMHDVSKIINGSELTKLLTALAEKKEAAKREFEEAKKQKDWADRKRKEQEFEAQKMDESSTEDDVF